MTKNESASSQILSGPQGSPSSSVVEKPWSGRLHERESLAISLNVSFKCKEKVDDNSRIQKFIVYSP